MNTLLKNYVVINLEINFISGVEYEIIGFQKEEKIIGNNKFAEILQNEFDKIKQSWSDFDGRYSRSFAAKKTSVESKTCDVLPFLQMSI